MKTLPVEAKLFHADRRTDMTKLIVAFRNFVNAYENDLTVRLYVHCYHCFSTHSRFHDNRINPLNAELNPICYLMALLELTIFSTLAG